MVELTPDIESLTPLHWIAAVCAAITGIIHLFLGFSFLTSPLGWSFFAAAGGFFLGIMLLMLNIRRRLLYLVGIPFTGIQIPLWWFINAIEPADLLELGIGVTDKIVQVVLIVVLVVLFTRSSDSEPSV